MSTRVTFSPAATSQGRSPAHAPHTTRSCCRRYRRFIEHHWEQVDVLIGTLFASQRDFIAGNRVLSMESAALRDVRGHSRWQRIVYCSGVNLPRFQNIRNWRAKLISWAEKRIPMGSLVRTPTCLLDRLVDQVLHILPSNSLCSKNSEIALDFILWLDGTSSGLRAVSAVKFRLLDCKRTLFPTGLSPVTCWMETFCKETAIPLEHRCMMLSELNILWSQELTVGSGRIRMRNLLLLADHKQLNCLCGVQGGCTSQGVRFAHCQLPYFA